MAEVPDLVGLLTDNEAPSSKCYTCLHPVAFPLVPILIRTLREQQKQGKMLAYSRRSLFLSVVQQCKKEGAPFERTQDAFRNHLREHTTWFDAKPS